MAVAQTYMAQQQTGRGGPSGLADVLEVLLDKGLVIDAFVRVSLIGIELLTVDVRVVVASVDTYLRFAEAVNRLDLLQVNNSQNLGDLMGGSTKRSSSRSSSSSNDDDEPRALERQRDDEQPKSRDEEPERVEARNESEQPQQERSQNGSEAYDDGNNGDRSLLDKVKERGKVF